MGSLRMRRESRPMGRGREGREHLFCTYHVPHPFLTSIGAIVLFSRIHCSCTRLEDPMFVFREFLDQDKARIRVRDNLYMVNYSQRSDSE